MKKKPFTVLDVVETAYRLDGDQSSWLRGLGEAIYPILNDGLGMSIFIADVESAPVDWLDSSVFLHGAPWLEALGRGLQSAYPKEAIKTLYQPRPLRSLDDFMRALGNVGTFEDYVSRTSFAQYGVRDILGFGTKETGRYNVGFAIPYTKPRMVSPTEDKTWSRVAIHVAAARRLRARLGTDGPSRGAEAILAPSGRVEHAEGEAKKSMALGALRDAVARQEKARGRMRRDDPERALEIWRGLVAGRWSLVDHYEAGGRRYLVARRNEHDNPDPRALSSRESSVAHLAALGWSNKWIAYELGLSASTVATHLGASLKKLRLRSRSELASTLAKLGPRPSSRKDDAS